MSGSTGRRVAVIGTGVIGASWAALCLARGCTVSAWDPAEGAEARLRAYVDAFLPAIAGDDLGTGTAHQRIDWRRTTEEAVEDADFVQESGPECLELKGRLFSALGRAAPITTVIASSSSTLTASAIQLGSANPGRILVGHPFNPPHLIPLVEVVGGELTEPWAMDAAMDFYSSLGKRPIRLKREARGHVANRLQAALWQEALHLVQEGIAEVGDVDTAITHGPGLRWACMGPFMGLHLSGGEGGIKALFGKPLWHEVEEIWRNLGRVTMTPALAHSVDQGVAAEIAGRDLTTLAQERDRVLQNIIAAKADPEGQNLCPELSYGHDQAERSS